MNDTIPDDRDTRIAVEEAQRIIAKAKKAPAYDSYSYYGLRNQEEQLRSQVAYSVLTGSGIAMVRTWAMTSALVRDARPTYAEFLASRGEAAAA